MNEDMAKRILSNFMAYREELGELATWAIIPTTEFGECVLSITLESGEQRMFHDQKDLDIWGEILRKRNDAKAGDILPETG